MQQQTTISLWCERIIEAGWLLALALIPIYFNLLSSRHFEPDKATTLRAIVLMMAAAALVRALESMNRPVSSAAAAAVPSSSNPFGALWQRMNSVPLLIPALFYALVFIFATIVSVVPHTSFWGSYQRLQGTYTNLSYIALFVIVVATLRRREQLERIITITLLTALAVSGYGLVQHLELDPLPWRGDVITRVASTMGNAIFVAAYLVMVVPLALYRLIVTASDATHAPAASNARADILWAISYLLIIVGTMALLFSVIKFGAVVRTIDFRYWWVFPGAVIVSAALWSVLTVQPSPGDRNRAAPLWPGGLFAGYMLFFCVTYFISAGASSQVQIIAENVPRGLDWWLWMLGSVGCIGGFYALSLFLPRRPVPASRLYLGLQAVALFVLLLIMLATIFFSQSRGPWIGLGAGLVLFLLLALWQAVRGARSHESYQRARWLQIALTSVVVLTLAAGAFLVAFNVSNAPIFGELRQVPYLGRMGSLLETRYGTGRVRTLIWFGDEYGGGSVALITSNPLRTLVGWGPESMFVAYNPFYPPSLALIESRGASPDRSHQAILDELVTKGFLGLLSYLFLLISFFVLSWRLLRSSTEWHWQIFFIACMSIVTTHFIEGLTGIPIVSTLMMLWLTLGITVAGGMLAGQYVIGAAALPKPASEAQEGADEEPATVPPTGDDPASKQKARARKGGRGTTARGGASALRTGAAGVGSRRSAQAANPVAYALYTLIFSLALGAVWWFNLGTIYADMRFHEGQAFSEQQNAGIREHIVAMSKFIETINANPREDFYYLNLGRTLMTIADYQRSQGMPLGNEKPDAKASDLLKLEDVTEVASFVQRTSPMELMSYAEVTLLQARALNPLNKDHYANLARVNNFWYNWTRDPRKLEDSSEWYSKANALAPQDVMLLNEHVNVLLLLSSYFSANKDPASAQAYVAQARSLLERAHQLDPGYGDATIRLAEMYRQEDRLAEAADLYAEAISLNPDKVNPLVEDLIPIFSDQPDLLLKLRTAYMDRARRDKEHRPLLYSLAGLISVRAGDIEGALAPYKQAVKLDPDNLGNRLNYTIVLSDTERYDEALAQAQQGLELAEQQKDKKAEMTQFQYLINLLRPKVAGGQ